MGAARSVIEFEAGGVMRAIRPTFSAIDAIEGAVAKSCTDDEIKVHGTGLALLVAELKLPAPRLGMIGRCATVMLAQATPPLLEPASHEAVFEPGLTSWLIDPDHPQGWGPLVLFCQLAQYGPANLQKFLDEAIAGGEHGEPEPPASDAKKKRQSHGVSWWARLCRLLNFST